MTHHDLYPGVPGAAPLAAAAASLCFLFTRKLWKNVHDLVEKTVPQKLYREEKKKGASICGSMVGLLPEVVVWPPSRRPRYDRVYPSFLAPRVAPFPFADPRAAFVAP